MGKTLPTRQKWLEQALQGLAFWIGYRHSYFRHWPLVEGALVAEACNLIQANLPSELVLKPECMYKNLVPPKNAENYWDTTIRADLVICSEEAKRINRRDNISKYTKYVIEVKRGSSTEQEINEDLRRLHKYLGSAINGTRCFLFIIYENKIPLGSHVKGGKAIKKRFAIPDSDGYYHVRRVMKASASFNISNKSAHYVCLIEVFLKSQDKKQLPGFS